MDLKGTILHAFGWSNSEHQEVPKKGWNSIKHDPQLIPVLKEIIKECKFQGDDLLTFHWWMGVTLDIIPSQLK